MDCLEIDIIKCRRAVPENSDMDFPKPCVLDTIQSFTGQAFDYAYVDAGPANLTALQQYCFYNGPRWHHRRAFELARGLETVRAMG